MSFILLFYTYQKFLVTMVIMKDGEAAGQTTIEDDEQMPLFTVLDNLASIGGLTIPLYIVGSGLISISNFLSGNELMFYFLTHLYKSESEEFKQSNEKGIQPASIMKRKPFAVRIQSCICCSGSKYTRIYNKGMKRAYHELEIVRLIKM